MAVKIKTQHAKKCSNNKVTKSVSAKLKTYIMSNSRGCHTLCMTTNVNDTCNKMHDNSEKTNLETAANHIQIIVTSAL